jgi:hypothetical protein
VNSRRSFFKKAAQAFAIIALAPQIAFRSPKLEFGEKMKDGWWKCPSLKPEVPPDVYFILWCSECQKVWGSTPGDLDLACPRCGSKFISSISGRLCDPVAGWEKIKYGS